MDGQHIAVVLGLLLILLGFVFGGCFGTERGRSIEKEAAIKAGAGYWTVDEKSGTTKFEYKGR